MIFVLILFSLSTFLLYTLYQTETNNVYHYFVFFKSFKTFILLLFTTLFLFFAYFIYPSLGLFYLTLAFPFIYVENVVQKEKGWYEVDHFIFFLAEFLLKYAFFVVIWLNLLFILLGFQPSLATLGAITHESEATNMMFGSFKSLVKASEVKEIVSSTDVLPLAKEEVFSMRLKGVANNKLVPIYDQIDFIQAIDLKQIHKYMPELSAMDLALRHIYDNEGKFDGDTFLSFAKKYDIREREVDLMAKNSHYLEQISAIHKEEFGFLKENELLQYNANDVYGANLRKKVLSFEDFNILEDKTLPFVHLNIRSFAENYLHEDLASSVWVGENYYLKENPNGLPSNGNQSSFFRIESSKFGHSRHPEIQVATTFDLLGMEHFTDLLRSDLPGSDLMINNRLIEVKSTTPSENAFIFAENNPRAEDVVQYIFDSMIKKGRVINNVLEHYAENQASPGAKPELILNLSRLYTIFHYQFPHSHDFVEQLGQKIEQTYKINYEKDPVSIIVISTKENLAYYKLKNQ